MPDGGALACCGMTARGESRGEYECQSSPLCPSSQGPSDAALVCPLCLLLTLGIVISDHFAYTCPFRRAAVIMVAEQSLRSNYSAITTIVRVLYLLHARWQVQHLQEQRRLYFNDAASLSPRGIALYSSRVQ